MKGLVEDLLTLARADEAAAGTTEDALRHDEVDLSSLVDEAALEFDAVAFSLGYEMSYTSMLHMLQLAGIRCTDASKTEE